MAHLINSENGNVYPPPPDQREDVDIWLAMVSMIDSGRMCYDPETDELVLLQS